MYPTLFRQLFILCRYQYVYTDYAMHTSNHHNDEVNFVYERVCVENNENTHSYHIFMVQQYVL